MPEFLFTQYCPNCTIKAPSFLIDTLMLSHGYNHKFIYYVLNGKSVEQLSTVLENHKFDDVVR